MADIIVLKPVIPKQVRGHHAGQKFILTFNPNARDKTEQWHWHAIVTCTFEYHGNSTTEGTARAAAKAYIDRFNTRTEIA